MAVLPTGLGREGEGCFLGKINKFINKSVSDGCLSISHFYPEQSSEIPGIHLLSEVLLSCHGEEWQGQAGGGTGGWAASMHCGSGA